MAARPPLHILLVGEDPASKVYVGAKERAGVETGLKVTVHRMPATITGVSLWSLPPSCDGLGHTC